MKKTFLLSLLGLATTTAATSFGQGFIVLDNYDTYGPYITYGEAGIPMNGSSGAAGAQGGNVFGNPGGTSPWTVGVYYFLGSTTVGNDPNSKPIGDPSTFTGGLTLGTGSGATAGINDDFTPASTGAFLTFPWAVPGSSSAGGQTLTLELVAYSGADYNSSLYRGHSAPFTMTTRSAGLALLGLTGLSEPAFSVWIVPEPSVLALSGIGAAALMLFRRKK